MTSSMIIIYSMHTHLLLLDRLRLPERLLLLLLLLSRLRLLLLLRLRRFLSEEISNNGKCHKTQC